MIAFGTRLSQPVEAPQPSRGFRSRELEKPLARLRRVDLMPAERFLIDWLLKAWAEHPLTRIGLGRHPLPSLLAGLFYLSAQRLEIERRFANFRGERENHGVHCVH